MRAQASHVGVKKKYFTVLIPELKNFGVASDFTYKMLLTVDWQ